MKTIAVTISLELEVPDEWELEKTSDGIDVINMGEGQYLDLTFEPMVTRDKEGTWTNSLEEGFMDALLDRVVSEDVSYVVVEPPLQ